MEEANGLYAHSRACVLSRYEGRISGSGNGLFLVLCDAAPGDSVRNALVKTAESLGWGADGATFALTDGLNPHELFELVEGLDPVALVIAGPASAQGFFSAFHVEPTTCPCFRAFCRETRLLPDLEAQIESHEGKQRVWSVLKTLPRP